MKLKKIIKEHSSGELPSSKLMKMKWNPVTDPKPVNERLSRQALDRLEGLHNLRTMKTFLAAGKDLAKELYDEGFENDEILDFFYYKLQRAGIR